MDLFQALALQMAISLADSILDGEGKFSHLSQKELFYPNRFGGYSDGEIVEFMKNILTLLKRQPDVIKRIERLRLPVASEQIANWIRFVVHREGELSDRDLRMAVLSALLCPLRQKVGSCFATAPAILIQREKPRLLLEDLESLLFRGFLQRTFGGVEYTVPISPSPGLGDLDVPFSREHPGALRLGLYGNKQETFLSVIERIFPEDKRSWAKGVFIASSDHLLLRVWEYTIASFVDVKAEFSGWNFYTSLGLNTEEEGGIGEQIQLHLQRHLDGINEKIRAYQREYEAAFDELKMVEALMRNVTSEAEGRRRKAEHIARLHHFRSCEIVRDQWREKGEKIAQFYSFYLEYIFQQISQYFQEAYDCEMKPAQATPFDDIPAGFRLLYKHGRKNVASWTFIHNETEYIQALRSFFFAIEHSLVHMEQWGSIGDIVQEITTMILHHFEGDEFIQASQIRLAKARHSKPDEKIKPWAYTSGGTVSTLLKTYFRKEGAISEEKKWVKSPTELLIFLLETLKGMPPSMTNHFLEGSRTRLLMTSPTHAFSLLPSETIFQEGWKDRGFTYTWVRDQIIQPARSFYSILEPQDQISLLNYLGYTARVDQARSVASFRAQLPQDPQIDAALFSLLPILSVEEVAKLFRALKLKQNPPQRPHSRIELHNIAVDYLSTISTKNAHALVAKMMRQLRLSPPLPVIFADPNWSSTFFSFVFNPCSENLEIWMTDSMGLRGKPMVEWEAYLNGSASHHWTVYTELF